MRSTIEIICAVDDCKPVTLEECKMALMALSSVNHFVEHSLRELADAVSEGKPSVKFRAIEAHKTLDRMFEARKKDPLLWLGPGNTPGRREHAERQRFARQVFKRATGKDIEDLGTLMEGPGGDPDLKE